MQIEIIDNDQTSKFFVFSGRPATLPVTSQLFDNRADAAKQGYYIAAYLLEAKQIQSVKCFQYEGTDCIEVTLQKGMHWKDAFANAISDKLTHDFLHKAIPLYQHPDSIHVPTNLAQHVNELIETSEEPVFRKIREDGGIKAIGWESTPLIKVHFLMSGRCANDCVNGDTNPTQSSVKTAVRSKFPYITDCQFTR